MCDFDDKECCCDICNFQCQIVSEGKVSICSSVSPVAIHGDDGDATGC